MSSVAAARQLSRARSYVAARTAYFRKALLFFVYRELAGLGTCAVTKSWHLLYDPVQVLAWSVEELAGVLVHELLHMLDKHWLRIGSRDPELWNIAADLAINCIVALLGFKLPKGVLWPELYGLPRGRTAEQYYKDLQQMKAEGRLPPPPASDAAGEGKPGTGKGWCGSGAGRPVPGEPSPSDPTGRSEGEGDGLCRSTARQVQEAAKGRGANTIPDALSRWAGTVLEPPRVSWRTRLSVETRSAVAVRPGAVDFRYSRPSRRQAGIGYGPGHAVLPGLVMPQPEVAVLFDTSASMGKAEFSVGVREVRGLLRALNASVALLAVDTKLRKVGRVKRWEDVADLLKGGGGTDLRPGFDAAMKLRPRPQILVVVTDGQVGNGIPQHAPLGLRVIFLLVGKFKRRPCPWGAQIEMDDEPPKA